MEFAFVEQHKPVLNVSIPLKFVDGLKKTIGTKRKVQYLVDFHN